MYFALVWMLCRSASSQQKHKHYGSNRAYSHVSPFSLPSVMLGVGNMKEAPRIERGSPWFRCPSASAFPGEDSRPHQHMSRPTHRRTFVPLPGWPG